MNHGRHGVLGLDVYADLNAPGTPAVLLAILPMWANGGHIPDRVSSIRPNESFDELKTVGPAGLEPATRGLKVRCSTN